MLSEKCKEFIKENINANTDELALKKTLRELDYFAFAVAQIKSRQKIKDKIPSFYNNYDLILPPNISLEQASSELTAEYKANIFNYETSADLTGGMGLDSIAFAKKAKKHFYIEKNTELCKIFEHNAKILGLTNIIIINDDAENFLKSANQNFDLIYLDPARRGSTGEKTYFFEHTSPNPIDIIKLAEHKYKSIMIKASPLMDITKACNSIPAINDIRVVSVQNECKETLFSHSCNSEQRQIFAIDFQKSGIIETKLNSNPIKIEYSEPLQFLYEPNSSIMKIGAWDKFNFSQALFKLAKSSHLFTSNEYISDFPGRKFKINEVIKGKYKNLKDSLPNGKANISVRNYPISVDEIRKKTGVKDGGDIFLFFTKLADNSNIIICTEKCFD